MDAQYIHNRSIWLMGKTHQTLETLLSGVSQERATTLRDGADGWTALEVLCHLRDFNEIFLQRAQAMLAGDTPTLVAYDHEALARERRYNEQVLSEVLADYAVKRNALIAFFTGLGEADWDKGGVHPEAGPIDLSRQALQAATHEADHIEQIIRILAQ